MHRRDFLKCASVGTIATSALISTVPEVTASIGDVTPIFDNPIPQEAVIPSSPNVSLRQGLVNLWSDRSFRDDLNIICMLGLMEQRNEKGYQVSHHRPCSERLNSVFERHARAVKKLVKESTCNLLKTELGLDLPNDSTQVFSRKEWLFYYTAMGPTTFEYGYYNSIMWSTVINYLCTMQDYVITNIRDALRTRNTKAYLNHPVNFVYFNSKLSAYMDLTVEYVISKEKKAKELR